MEASEKIEQLPGFKIAGSHFRIGTKIHISDFYYAKRFFQNSFYSSRLAFIIARDIADRISQQELRSIRSKGLTLIGYGIYSELLLSFIEKFLRIKWSIKAEKLNHNIVLDTENLALVKVNEQLKNVIIIVPIASTFSTSIKIEEILKKKFDHCDFIPPHINVLYISDGPLHSIPSKKESEFGWKKIDLAEREIEIEAYYDANGASKKQKFYLSLESEWLSVEECKHCFPALEKNGEPVDAKLLLKERPLLETDRTAVTPTLIFDFPRARRLTDEEQSQPFILNQSLVQYGHHTRNNSHFLFSIKTEEFFVENYDKIEDWLDKLGSKKALENYLDTDNVLLVSSCHYSNAAFINLVNEQLFSSAANIIHYDPTNDYIQNFEMIYGEEIARADKIIFVDDAIKSGDTFIKIHDFIDYTLRNRKPDERHSEGISLCILLANLSQPFTMASVERRIGVEHSVYAFANLHLFTSLSHNEVSPLVIEEERYRQLVEDSFLDSLKVHFLNQTIKLSVGEYRDYDSQVKKERHLLMMEVTHRIYEYFTSSHDQHTELGKFHEFSLAIFGNTTIKNSFATYFEQLESSLSQKDASLIKVLSQSPFTQYEPLRKKTFEWVLSMLDEQVDRVVGMCKPEDPTLTYVEFENLKFLVRRAGLLNSNYLISDKIFQLIGLLYTPSGIYLLKEQIELDLNRELRALEEEPENEILKKEVSKFKGMLKNVKDFGIFYVAQVKELLLKNEDRSIHLERTLSVQKNFSSPGHAQLIRILVAENGVIIKKFYEHVSTLEKWKQIYNAGEVISGTDLIASFLNEGLILKNHKYQSLNRFFYVHSLDISKPVPQDYSASNNCFLIYLWLMYYISFDEKKVLTLSEKTTHIFEKLVELIQLGKGIDKVGAFFVVKNSRKSDPAIVYDRNHRQAVELGSSTLNNPMYAYLNAFIDGKEDESRSYHKSIVELRRDNSLKKWIDIYSTKPDEHAIGLDYNFLPKEINRIVLVRLNKRKPDLKEKSQGLMAFYFQSGADSVTDLSILRYIHLLRGPMSNFIEKHHENNEFRDWQVAEITKKLAVLSGHGKEMLKDLCYIDLDYLSIANQLEQLQLIVMFNETAKRRRDKDRIVERFNHFFHVDGSQIIDERFFTSISKMAGEIYTFTQIEDKVDCDILPIKEIESLPFAFNSEILRLIFFEIIVNAKKNRWHFLPSEKVDKYTRNFLKIKAEISSGQKGRILKIEVANLGPAILNDDLEKLKNPHTNIKPHEATAGTALIKTLIYNYLDGDIDFDSEIIDDQNNLAEFTVKIKLREMEAKHG